MIKISCGVFDKELITQRYDLSGQIYDDLEAGNKWEGFLCAGLLSGKDKDINLDGYHAHVARMHSMQNAQAT